jgi:ABC-type multidrug transport system ATPase subunit
MTESEKLVQGAFERVAKGRTTVAVAHRLATIQNADIIYVLGEGKVLESGSHSELLRHKGVYYHMVSELLICAKGHDANNGHSVTTRPLTGRWICIAGNVPQTSDCMLG